MHNEFILFLDEFLLYFLKLTNIFRGYSTAATGTILENIKKKYREGKY